jgi:hypothetical protein
MSGIAGYFHQNAGMNTGSASLKTMLQAMSVDGSCDIRMLYETSGIAVGGMVSNSIEDIVCWSDAETVIAFQGHITNQIEIAKKLTISLKHRIKPEGYLIHKLYKKLGRDTASVLKGRFCFALWDKRKRRLYLATDRYGYGFIYYYHSSNGFFFGSEIKSILSILDHTPLPNMHGICDMHNFTTVFNNDTPFKNIYLLPYGSMCLLDKNSFTIQKYWEYPKFTSYYTEDEPVLIERAKEKLFQAVLNSVRDYDHLGVMVSGGLDSRLLSGMIHKLYPHRKQKLFHVNTGLKNELNISIKISQALGVPIEIFEEGIGNVAETFYDQTYLTDGHLAFLNFLPSIQAIGKYNKGIAILNGYLLDTMFKSSFAFFPGKDSSSAAASTTDYIHKFSFLNDTLARRVFKPNFAELLRKKKWESIEVANQGFNHAPPAEGSLRFYCINRGRRSIYFFSKIFEHFVHMVLPGIDYDLQDFAMKLPYKFRNNTGFYRRIICELFPDLAKIEWDKTGKPLQHGERDTNIVLKRNLDRNLNTILYGLLRASYGHIDFLSPERSFDRYFRQEKRFRDRICKILVDKRTLNRGFCTRDGIDLLIRRQLSGRNHATLIRTIINVEFLYRRFFDA